MSKQGILEFDNYEKRYIIIFEDGKTFNRALHCGDVLEIKTGESWKTVRIEYYNDWYFTDANIKIKSGLIVRIA